MGTYIAFGIIVVLLLCFLAWAWDEPAGGIIAIIAGVIVFFSGSRTAGIIVGIVGVVCYSHAKDSKKKAKIAASKNSSKNYFSIELQKLLEKCWNTDTLEFNWKLWFDEDWVLYAGGDENLEKELRKQAGSELESCGRAQIGRINAFLNCMQGSDVDRDRVIMTIKRNQTLIIRDLGAMFDASSEPLRREVQQYQTDIYDYIIYGKKTLSPEKLSYMIKRGDAISQGNIK